jgi:hypothetical protein
VLKGSLDDFTLPDIFRLLSVTKKTGSLEVERSAGQGTVYFREGDVYFAESSLSRELLGQKLVKAGAITSSQLMKALDAQAGSDGQRLGEVLVADGLVDGEQLETAVRGQIEDAVFDLLRWELGEFSWNLGEEVSPEVVLSVSVENLIMEASRRLDELVVIQRKIPSEQSVLTMASTPPEGAVEINITPDEWRVMVMVNGQRTVQEIADGVQLDVFQTMRTLYGLVSAGLIEVPGHTPPDDDEDVDLSIFQDAVLAEPVLDEVVDDELVGSLVEPMDDAGLATDEPQYPDADDAVASLESEAAQELAASVAEDLSSEGDATVVPFEMGDASVEGFDAPAPGELTTETPDVGFETPAEQYDEAPVERFDEAPVERFDEAPAERSAMPADTASLSEGEDPFASEILSPEPVSDPFGEMPVAPEESEGSASAFEDLAPATDIPVTAEPPANEPTVDKSAAVRELSNLFKQTEVDSSTPTFMVPPANRDEESVEEPENKKRVEDDEEITRGLISRLIDGVKGL